jgi:hypothetical protein
MFRSDFGIVTSGLSNSIAFSEGLIGYDSTDNSKTYKDSVAKGILGHYSNAPLRCLNVRGKSGFFANDAQETFTEAHFLGKRVWDNRPVAYAFYALLPPNSPSCSASLTNGWVSATSSHVGGVNVSLLDGAMKFIPDSIDTQNLGKRSKNRQWQCPKPCEHLNPWMVDDGPSHYPTDPDTDRTFSYGVWAELGAVNSRETIPSL